MAQLRDVVQEQQRQIQRLMEQAQKPSPHEDDTRSRV